MKKTKDGQPVLMPYAALVDLIDRDSDIPTEETRRNQSVFPLQSGPKQTFELGGQKFQGVQMTPQLYCIQAKKLNPFRYFLSKSPHPNTCTASPAFNLMLEYTKSGHTLLHLAILACAPEFVHLILSYGVSYYKDLANKKLNDETGNTPLHLAVLTESEGIVVDLLNFGADPFLRNARGLLPVQLALAKKGSLASVLLKRMTALNPAFRIAMIKSSSGGVPNMAEVFNSKAQWNEFRPNGRECSATSCSCSRKLSLCYKCGRLFCPFHIERHFHEKGNDGMRQEYWRL